MLSGWLWLRGRDNEPTKLAHYFLKGKMLCTGKEPVYSIGWGQPPEYIDECKRCKNSLRKAVVMFKDDIVQLQDSNRQMTYVRLTQDVTEDMATDLDEMYRKTISDPNRPFGNSFDFMDCLS